MIYNFTYLLRLSVLLRQHFCNGRVTVSSEQDFRSQRFLPPFPLFFFPSVWGRSLFMLQNSSICFLFIWSLCVTEGEKLPSTLQNSNYKISAVVFKLHSDNFKYAQVAEHRAVWTSNQLAFLVLSSQQIELVKFILMPAGGDALDCC